MTGAGATPNTTVENPDSVGPTYRPGDPNQAEFEAAGPVQNRMAAVVTSPWDGWPAQWATPAWGSGSTLEQLTDVAWAALDLNSSVLSAMPVYRTRSGRVLPPTTWMTNPDPDIYTDWSEFAKQLFWDFQAVGEAFVLPMARAADGWPSTLRVVPPPLMTVEMGGGRRIYKIGSLDVTDEILHIRYKSTTDTARGIGPLESGRARLVQLSVLARYAAEITDGAIPKYVLETEQLLTRAQASDLLEQWWASRIRNMGEPWKPAVLSGGVKANPLQLTPQEMALSEQTGYNEARIAVLLGVPPYLLGLPTNEPMTYSNVTQLFDFHDRRYLKTAATRVMAALSGWALPRGQSVELNRDEYSRPALPERAEAYEKLVAVGALSSAEIRVMERLTDADLPDEAANDDGEDLVAAEALTGGGRS
ncbi:MAG TPA: phage portal protein [Acidimicrobiales bacterium]